MGCDGGTIPKRDELVKTKKKPEQKDKAAEANFRWQHCALSQAPLQQPVVACELGRIYNKDSVIETLLNKASAEEAPIMISHIKSLRDVKTLNLTENLQWAEASQVGDGYNDNNKAQWICPISSQEMNGIFRFVFLWTCGCVFSEKAQKEIMVNECLKCQKPFTPADVIILNPTEEEEVESLRTKMEARRLKVKDDKKAKKSTKVVSATATSLATSSAGPSSATSGTAVDVNPKSNSKIGIKVELNGKRPAKIEKLEAKDAKLSKIAGNYSVAKDPSVSATYKSLFTSSETASSQQRAHWVTYNPFYN